MRPFCNDSSTHDILRRNSFRAKAIDTTIETVCFGTGAPQYIWGLGVTRWTHCIFSAVIYYPHVDDLGTEWVATLSDTRRGQSVLPMLFRTHNPKIAEAANACLQIWPFLRVWPSHPSINQQCYGCTGNGHEGSSDTR